MPPTGRSSKKLRAVGITCGIGSMLVGARQAGFDVVGNIEWRRYYHAKDEEGRNTFLDNFPGAFMKLQVENLTEEELIAATGCDLAIGHPECGLYSQMQGCNNFRGGKIMKEKQEDPGDIPLFLDLIARLRPRFFVMDDLPKSFLACPMEEYHRRLPDYDLFPEWISNYHYGNVQRRRVRMFMIGARKEEGFVFRPGEFDHELTIERVLQGLPIEPSAGEIFNHDPHTETEAAGRALHMDHLWHRPTYGDLRKWFEKRPEGCVFEYHSTAGGVKKKPGWYKQRWNGTCAVIDGGSGHTHPKRNLPFTIRERARIQGFPDDFLFYGTKYGEEGTWNHERNIHMVKQTGKAMPVQFCRYVSEIIAAHIHGKEQEVSGLRMVKGDKYVDEAKTWFCDNVGYADQRLACSHCWMEDRCSIRVEKYGLPVITPLPTRIMTLETITPENTEEVIEEGLDIPVAVAVKRDRKIPVKTPRVIAEVQTKVIRYENPEAEGFVLEDPVNLVEEKPEDYHCDCRFCSEVIGNLIKEDGSPYSRLERRKYYEKGESGAKGHAAKTPLHLARWAVQTYTQEGDWVLDPTAGAGTTLVESLVQNRNAAGMELQYHGIIDANVRRHAVGGRRAVLGFGDARNLGAFLRGTKIPRPSLVVNNPPYSGDEHQTTLNLTEHDKEVGNWSTTFQYDKQLPNLAFLKEGEEYWDTMMKIYSAAVGHLLVGGHIVIGVKDMMRNKTPFMLHRFLCEVLEQIPGLVFVGTAFLKHYPATLFLNTYEKMYGARPPLYQTINVFRKDQ